MPPEPLCTECDKESWVFDEALYWRHPAVIALAQFLKTLPELQNMSAARRTELEQMQEEAFSDQLFAGIQAGQQGRTRTIQFLLNLTQEAKTKLPTAASSDEEQESSGDEEGEAEERLEDYPDWLLDQLTEHLKEGQLERQKEMSKSLAKVGPEWLKLSAEQRTKLEDLLKGSETPVAGVTSDLWYLFCQHMDCSLNNATRTCGKMVDHSQWTCNKHLQQTRARQACDGLDEATLNRLWELHDKVDLTTLDFSKDKVLKEMDPIRVKALLNMKEYKYLKASTSKPGPSSKAGSSKQNTARMSAGPSTSKPSSSKKAAANNKPGLSEEPDNKKKSKQ
jgi:hypothetical protein